MNRNRRIVQFISILGFIFLYVPIISLIIFSFNNSKLVSVWSGFSTKWYFALLQNEQIIEAAKLSVFIAAFSATISLILGTLAAIALSRYRSFRGKSLLSGMVSAPLIMPDVITGLSLLLLFVTLRSLIGWPAQMGAVTIIIAHISFGMAFVAIIVQSRLLHFDKSLEEAAKDLGAKPLRVFFDITLPIISPALISGWLLAFTLSFDDLVIASFVTGPGASTLPIVIFSKIRLGITPEINALATIIIVLVAIFATLAMLQMKKIPE